ncbi:MAG: alpha/beta hydrolase [Caldimonas sp.]
MPAGACVERDLSYGTDPAQCLDVYLPAGPPTGAILAIVHGGAWSIGDKANTGVVDAKAAHWLPSGIVLVSVNYRLLPRAGVLQQAGDVARAIAFVQKRADGWKADPARLVVIGHSTGAHLAALLLADPALAEAEGAEPWLATILLDSAALDVVEIMRRPHRPLYDRAFGAAESGWQALSPLHRLRARPAPLLLVHSDRRQDAAGASQRFAAAVAARGGRAEVHEVALSHAEINARLGLSSAYTERVDAFLKSVGVP